MFFYPYFQLIGSIIFQQRSYVIGKTIKSAPMCFSGRNSVYNHIRICHNPIKPQTYVLTSPIFRYTKCMTINPLFHTGILNPFLLIPTPVGIFTKTLQLPLRRHFYLTPLPAVPTLGTIKLPGYTIAQSGTGKITALCLLRPYAKSGQ